MNLDFWNRSPKVKEPRKISRVEAQAQIDGEKVAQIIREFQTSVGEEYVSDPHLLAVGPLQSLLGVALLQGHLSLPSEDREITDEWARLARQFDVHRMAAMTMLRTVVANKNDLTQLAETIKSVEIFLAAPPPSGGTGA